MGKMHTWRNVLSFKGEMFIIMAVSLMRVTCAFILGISMERYACIRRTYRGNAVLEAL